MKNNTFDTFCRKTFSQEQNIRKKIRFVFEIKK